MFLTSQNKKSIIDDEKLCRFGKNIKTLSGGMMAVYIVLAVLSVGCAAWNGASERLAQGRGRMLFCCLWGIALTVISGVRLSVGYDYNLYANVFYDMNFMDDAQLWQLRREKGFVLLLKLVNVVTEDYTVCFAVLSLIIYPLLMYFVYRHSCDPAVSVLAFLCLGLFFNSLNFIPQFIAALIGAYALDYAVKGCGWRFFVLALLAAAFHRSALIILPCALLVYIGWNGVTLAIALAGSAVMWFFSRDILTFVTRYVYTYYDLEKNPEMANGLSPYYAVMFGVVFLAAYLLRKKLSGDERENNMLLSCAYGAFFFELIGTRFAVVSRFALLFAVPVAVLLVPKVYKAAVGAFERRAAGRIAAAVMCVLMTANYGVLLSRNYNGVVPYRTVFSSEEAD